MTEPMKPSVTQADRELFKSIITAIARCREAHTRPLIREGDPEWLVDALKRPPASDDRPISEPTKRMEKTLGATFTPATDTAGDALREAVEAAYREGHQRGRIDGSCYEEDTDWSNSDACAALSQPSPDEGAGAQETARSADVGREAMRQACIAVVRSQQQYEGSDFPVCNLIVHLIENLPSIDPNAAELGDLPSRLMGWAMKARIQRRDRIELDLEAVDRILAALTTPPADDSLGRLREGLREAAETLSWAARRMKGNCSGSDVDAVNLAAGNALALSTNSTLSTKEASGT